MPTAVEDPRVIAAIVLFIGLFSLMVLRYQRKNMNLENKRKIRKIFVFSTALLVGIVLMLTAGTEFSEPFAAVAFIFGVGTNYILSMAMGAIWREHLILSDYKDEFTPEELEKHNRTNTGMLLVYVIWGTFLWLLGGGMTGIGIALVGAFVGAIILTNKNDVVAEARDKRKEVHAKEA